MAEYIDRHALKNDGHLCWHDGKGNVYYDVDHAPAADVVEVRHGDWIECDWVKYDGHGECVHFPKAAYCCSVCRNAFKKELLWKNNYCPNCGAKMDGKGDGE